MIKLRQITKGDTEKDIMKKTQLNFRDLFNNSVFSNLDGEPEGSKKVNNIVYMTQAAYDAAVVAGTTVEGTIYITIG